MAKNKHSVEVRFESESQTRLATVELSGPGLPLREVLKKAAPDLGVDDLEAKLALVNDHVIGLDAPIMAGDKVLVLSRK